MSFSCVIRNAIKKKPDWRFPLVAILEKGGIAAIGTNNMEKTHTTMFGGDHARRVHAEVDALRKYRGDLDGFRLWVIRFLKNGNFGTSKPCDLCQKYILEELARRGGGKLTVIYYDGKDWVRESYRA